MVNIKQQTFLLLTAISMGTSKSFIDTKQRASQILDSRKSVQLTPRYLDSLQFSDGTPFYVNTLGVFEAMSQHAERHAEQSFEEVIKDQSAEYEKCLRTVCGRWNIAFIMNLFYPDCGEDAYKCKLPYKFRRVSN